VSHQRANKHADKVADARHANDHQYAATNQLRAGRNAGLRRDAQLQQQLQRLDE
jgi:hypothetical protein